MTLHGTPLLSPKRMKLEKMGSRDPKWAMATTIWTEVPEDDSTCSPIASSSAIGNGAHRRRKPSPGVPPPFLSPNTMNSVSSVSYTLTWPGLAGRNDGHDGHIVGCRLRMHRKVKTEPSADGSVQWSATESASGPEDEINFQD